MKRFAAVVLAAVGTGCATSGSVDDLTGRVIALEGVLEANEKALGKSIEHMHTVERDVKSVEFRLADLRRRVDRLDSGNATPSGIPDIDEIAGAPGLSAEEREKLAAYFKQLGAWAPEKAVECALDFPATVLIPHLISAIRPGREAATRSNALHVLSKWRPAEAAPILERGLSDGSVRGDLLRLLEAMEPHDEVRQALLKHSAEGDESWRISVAAALARAQSREGLRLLIAFLHSEDPGRRTVAIEALKEATGFDLGYKTYAGKDDRKAATEKWESWWSQNGESFVFRRR
ncbi:MAG: HEAT repeat domain-containing protein [Candidatus Brocadiae bacterium]|nr:HEAT repeat domain-containing protein [Candidatus Brocadiia bacterium]